MFTDTQPDPRSHLRLPVEEVQKAFYYIRYYGRILDQSLWRGDQIPCVDKKSFGEFIVNQWFVDTEQSFSQETLEMLKTW